MEKCMMETKTCKKCRTDITSLHGNALYCKKCAKEQKKRYNKKYMLQFPKSARNGIYYKYYKFLLTLAEDELMALHRVKKIACKENNANISHLKTQIVLINEAMKRKGVE